MSAEAVEAAVERIRYRDAELARHAEVAASALMAGEDPAVLSQAWVQHWVWWDLPTKFPEEYWWEVARGAALLLDELGLGRYAEIMRSELTAGVLAGWAHSRRSGIRSARAAVRRSGVEPPDTDLLEWGDVMGPDEAAAQDAVEWALEEAIVGGRLLPGRTGWKRQAVEECNRVLTTPVEQMLGQTPLGLVTTERVETWIMSARHSDHHRWCRDVANLLLAPIEAPDEAAEVVAPMRWLLAQSVDGARITPSDYLERRTVIRAVERFGWWAGTQPPRSQIDVPELGLLREIATGLRLVRRRGRLLTATTAGRALVDDPAGLWARVARTLGGTGPELDRVVAELIGLRLLHEGPVDHGLAEQLTPILVEHGWRTSSGPLPVQHVARTVERWLFWWRLLGLLRAEPTGSGAGHDAGEAQALTPAGRATVLAYLRDRALRPRRAPGV